MSVVSLSGPLLDMAIPEDILDLWSEFPMQLKTEPLDHLFALEPKAKLPRKPSEPPTSVVTYATKSKDMDTELPSDTRSEKFDNVLEVIESDSGMVGGTLKTSKLYAYEDFLSFLAREGGIEPERLSRLVDNVSPVGDEDFVSFLARNNGIKDEQLINRLRQSLKLEPAIDFKCEKVEVLEAPVKMEQDLNVGEGEDAASFFVRAGSWESSSSLSEELALVGLDEFVDEDAESFFRRTEVSSDTELDTDVMKGSDHDSSAVVTLLSTKHQTDALKGKVLGQVSGSSLQELEAINGQVLVQAPTPMDQDKVKKRKSCDPE